MDYVGEERRGGDNDRRAKSRGTIAVFVLTAAGIAAGFMLFGYGVGSTRAPDPVIVPDYTQELLAQDIKLDQILERQPEVRTVVLTRIVHDTVPVPYEVQLPPEIIRIYDTIPVFVTDTHTVYTPPQIIRIAAPPRTFWSSDTYKPSIGNTAWSVVALGLGYILGNANQSDARACVVINGEESCKF